MDAKTTPAKPMKKADFANDGDELTPEEEAALDRAEAKREAAAKDTPKDA